MQRARARSLYTHAHHPSPTAPLTLAPLIPTSHAPHTVLPLAPITYHLGGVFVQFAHACDLRPPSLCFRECYNTIVLNLKINTIQKRYSLNTHKTNPLTIKQIPAPKPIHKPPINLYTPRRAWYTWHITYNSNPLPQTAQSMKTVCMGL